MVWRGIIAMLLVILTCHLAVAQEPADRFQGDSIPFPDLVKALEMEHPVRIYYKPAWTDSLEVPRRLVDLPPEEAVQEATRGSDLSYIILEDEIILSKNFRIKTNYREDVETAYASHTVDTGSDTMDYRPLVREPSETGEINPEFRLHRIGNPALRNLGDEAVISGYITSLENAEPLVGAIVYLEDLNIGTAANEYGFYSIRLPKGQFTLEYRFVGMKTARRNVQLYSDGLLNVEMQEEIVSLSEVTVSTQGQQHVRSPSMGMERISIRQIKEIPMAFGEVDIIRSIVLLPGVQTVGEGAAGFHVRGGSAGQNLILMDRAPIMNTSHFIGFFSALNADIMKNATLYKSSIPARYGGRISSVLDFQTKEGNKKKISGSGGISPVMARLMVEGPITSNRSSFLLGVRSSYSNWVLKLLEDEKLKNSRVFFTDVNGGMTFDLNQKNSIYASGYYSHDHFDYYGEVAYQYSNAAATLTWKNVLSNKLFSLYSLVYSNYRYKTIDKSNALSASALEYAIGQYKADVEYTWFPTYNNKVSFGINGIWYHIDQGTLKPYGDASIIHSRQLEKEQALESAAFISSDYDITSNITVSAGLRLSSLMVFGPGHTYEYEDPRNRLLQEIKDTIAHARGELIKAYFYPEPRISVRVNLDEITSFKIGYTRIAQYLHMLSNTTAISPTDTWKLSDRYLLPQLGDQYGAGLYRNFLRNTLETSLELYYRKLKNIIDYTGGATLVMNEHLETDVLNGSGKAYGAELMVKKTRGKFTGWLSYSYTRIFHKITSEIPEKQVNEGDYFPANYDKPNNLSLVGNYRLSRRIGFSSTVDYSDGRPITVPLASFSYLGGERLQYSARNGYRIPYYFRWDLSITIDGNLKARKLAHSSLTLGMYNMTGRKNVYSVFFRTEDGVVKGYQLSVFSRPIPTITYNFKF